MPSPPSNKQGAGRGHHRHGDEQDPEGRRNRTLLALRWLLRQAATGSCGLGSLRWVCYFCWRIPDNNRDLLAWWTLGRTGVRRRPPLRSTAAPLGAGAGGVLRCCWRHLPSLSATAFLSAFQCPACICAHSTDIDDPADFDTYVESYLIAPLGGIGGSRGAPLGTLVEQLEILTPDGGGLL